MLYYNASLPNEAARSTLRDDELDLVQSIGRSIGMRVWVAKCINTVVETRLLFWCLFG